MSTVHDAQETVAGRFNVVDVAIGVLLIVLLPAAYGSYLLFRTPPPTLTEVLPASLTEGPSLQVEIHGMHLRPFMRVSFGDFQGADFLFVNSTTAVVPLPPMPPGRYDVVLYDYAQEVARLRAAFVLEPKPAPPTAQLDVTGDLTSLTIDQARKIGRGLKLFDGSGPIAEVLSVGAPEPNVLQIETGSRQPLAVPVAGRVQLPVTIRTVCVVEPTADGSLRCTVGGVALARGANVQLPALNTKLTLHVADLRPVDATRR